MNHEEARARRQRQYEIDRITARYEEDYRTGKSPRLEDYLQRYPDFARELKEFALYFHSIAVDLPEPDAIPAAELSPAAEHVLAQITSPPPDQVGEQVLTSLVKSGLAAGYPPPKLAEGLGISRDVLAKLEAHAIAASSLPRSFIQRVAQTLRVAPETVLAYFRGASPAQAGAFFYADNAPRQEQESFLEAIQASPRLTADQKREWAEIVARDVPGA
jgi:hypothetical protein